MSCIHTLPWPARPGGTSLVSEGKHVAVNSLSGVNRSGLLVRRALVALGYTPEEAIEAARRRREPWRSLDRDFVLTNALVYWLTKTAASAARLYYENAHAQPPTEPTTVPIGLAAFSGDFSGTRRFANRDHTNIVRWSTFEGGGHAAHKKPDVLVGDVREVFRNLR